MKALLLSRYDRLCASSRLRSCQYLPYLALQGVAVAPVALGGLHVVEDDELVDQVDDVENSLSTECSSTG